jgi:very-short-patch-repair endonuclease
MNQKQPPSVPPSQGGSSSLEASPDKRRFGGVCSLPEKGRAGEGFIPYNKNLTTLARENRRNPTKAENKIWHEILRKRQFANYKFLRQKPIGSYIVDFYCSELRLAIEIDGDSHVETIEYDAERTKLLNSLGLQVVRYTNDDVIRNIEGVYNHLSRVITNIENIDG